MDVPAIRDAIAARLKTISGLHVYDTVPDQRVVPAAIIQPRDPFVTVHTAMAGGLADLQFEVVVAVQYVSAAEAQDQLDVYVSSGPGHDKSVVDAIEGDRTLGGVVHDAVVSQVRDYGAVTEAEGQRYGAVTFDVDVQAARK